MVRLIGVLMIIACGAMTGLYKADEITKRFTAVQCAKGMVEQLLIMLEYEAPTVDEMLKRLKNCGVKQPLFIVALHENADRYTLLESIENSRDGFECCDKDKLKEYFTYLGTADRECEKQRTSAILAYLKHREQTLEPICKSGAKLARSLGVLVGALIALIIL